jgi:hypothetical protein
MGPSFSFFHCARLPGTSQARGYAMIEILNYVQPKTVFDPEFIQVLASAFDDAWNRIEESGSRFARPGYARAMREVIAKRIIETAQRGVKDKSDLGDDAVQFFTANYTDNCAAQLTETP